MSQNGEGNDGADSSFDEKLKPWIYLGLKGSLNSLEAGGAGKGTY